MRIAIPLLALSLLLAAPLAGQDVPEARPGSVVTLTLRPPADLVTARDSQGRLTLAYAVETAGGIQSISRTAGTFEWEREDVVGFPLTVRLPDRAEAGVLEVAIVAFETEDARVGSVSARVSVEAVRSLDLQLVAGGEAARSGEEVAFRYILSNRGNSADSVTLAIETNLGERPEAVPPAVWLAPFEERSAEFRLVVPPDLRAGSEGYVRLTARVAGVAVSDHAMYVVLPARGLFPDLVQIPTTVFLGSTITSFEGASRTEPVVAVAGNGKLGRRTDLLFNFRYMPRGGSVYAFRGLLSGPRLFVGLEHPSWGAGVGDLDVRTSDLLGFQLQGRGLQARWRARGLSVRGMAARPTGLDGSTVDGHVAAAEIGYDAGRAAASILASSAVRADPPGAPGSSVRAALARVQGSRGNHWLGIDAGPMDVQNRRTGETETGPSLDARYAYRGSRADVDVRFRRLPDLASDPRLPPSEFRTTGTVRFRRELSLMASVYDEAAPRSLLLDGTRVRGSRAGVRWGVRAWAVGLTGELRRVRGIVDDSRRTLRLDATLRAGAFALDGALGLGTSRVGPDAELAELYRIGGAWLGERGMATFHVTLSDDILQPRSTMLDAYGLYRLSRFVELYASATTYAVIESEGFAPRSISDGLTVQTGARLRVSHNRYVYSGIERFSTGTSDGRWRFSIGIQQGIPLPLPMRRPPAASGIVFEDLDGDGRRGADEPGLDGVMLQMGFERTVSLPGGHFEFRDSEPEAIRVDLRSLGPGFVPVPDFKVPPNGRVEIGVYRAGALRVTLFLDANDDGVWDASELPAAALSVSLTRDGQPWRLRTGADGSVSLSSMAPGTYSIEVDGRSLPARARAPDPRLVEVRGGETSDVRIPIPLRQINFSRFESASSSCMEGWVPCDDE